MTLSSGTCLPVLPVFYLWAFIDKRTMHINSFTRLHQGGPMVESRQDCQCED